MIYVTTEESIKEEVNSAARTLCNIYDSVYRGEYYLKDSELYKGDELLTEEDFMQKISLLSCDSDVDFTIFWGSTRVFTTVKMDDGSFAIGTTADKRVIDSVLKNGVEYYYSNIEVGDKRYAGYYIPIVNSSEKTVGMVFAGKPLDAARKNMRIIIGCFILISIGILALALLVFGGFSSKMVKDILDVRDFMEGVSSGSFEVKLNDRTLIRTDEVGDIARSAENMKNNLRILVERDPLTTLLNRRSCRKLIDSIQMQDLNYTAAMADIDHFKRINDSFGHACGDTVLRDISAIIKSETEKKGGFVSRWGGEEFLIILPNTDIDRAREFLENLLDIIRNAKFEWEGNNIPVTITAGAVQAQKDETPDEIINRADHLLYDGKNSGRNKIVT